MAQARDACAYLTATDAWLDNSRDLACKLAEGPQSGAAALTVSQLCMIYQIWKLVSYLRACGDIGAKLSVLVQPNLQVLNAFVSGCAVVLQPFYTLVLLT